MAGSSVASKKWWASGEGGSEDKTPQSVTTVEQYKDFMRLLTGEVGAKGEMN